MEAFLTTLISGFVFWLFARAYRWLNTPPSSVFQGHARFQ